MSASVLVAAAVVRQADEGLTWAELVESLPTDPASIFAVVLLAVFFGGILWLGRSSSGGKGGTPPAAAGRGHR